jgi:hypothetical protein
MLRAKTVAHWVGLPLIVGVVLSLAAPFLPPVVGATGTVLFLLGLAWLGFGVWSSWQLTSQPELPPMPFGPEMWKTGTALPRFASASCASTGAGGIQASQGTLADHVVRHPVGIVAAVAGLALLVFAWRRRVQFFATQQNDLELRLALSFMGAFRAYLLGYFFSRVHAQKLPIWTWGNSRILVKRRRKIMSIYTIVLFVHIIGAIGYFLSIGSWLFILVGLRRAQRVEEVRALIHMNDLSRAFGDGSGLVLLIAGLYLALSAWSLLTSWILVALISLILILPTNAVLIAPRRSALVKQLERSAPEGKISLALSQHIHNPVLWATSQTTAVLLLGIVFLMTTKPDLEGSLIVMAGALVLGLLSSPLVSRRRHTSRQEVADQRAQDNASAS